MHNRIKTALLLGALTVIMMFFGQVLGGGQGMKIAFVLSLLINCAAYWFSADLVLKQSGARIIEPADAPQLYELVEHLAQRADLPCPKVAIVEDLSPNAFATGRNPQNAVVAVTSGLLETMSREELAGVLSHELAHVKNRDILISSIAAVMAGGITILARMARFGAKPRGRDDDGNALAAVLMSLLAPAGALVIQAAVSRSREYLADDSGADIAGTPFGLASALEKLSQNQTGPVRATPASAHMYIVNPMHSRAMTNLFATHPPVEERIARLRGQIM